MLNEKELLRIKEAISQAEQSTSGEIRVCVAKKCKGTALQAAVKKFNETKMNATALRNAVLIYVCPGSQKTAIIGDKGINEIADDSFWDDALNAMMHHFKRGELADGICKGVQKVGELIKNHYPISENDINELSDEIIVEE